ncbi:DUF4013 domain-containing protein [Halomicroarcula sp. GCM10025709]|uniref:DUF4013 domain-containing protein n=1 Tax=Haloarcula TaxID=2237 RepID=UPI0024C28DC0|nr:DUF4013 domain-containing protein [Halomicroarcula sp. YJ-61-S]
MAYCTACGAAVDADDNFCEQCGHELGTPVSAADSTDGRARSGSASDTEPDDPFERDAAGFALGYPVHDEYEPFLLGSIVSLLGAILPPLQLFTAGYAVQLAEAAAHGDRTQPAFAGWRDLLVDGLRATVALVVLWGVAAALGASLTALLAEAGVGGAWEAGTLTAVALAGLYVTPAVLTTCAATGRVGASFSQRFAGAFAARPAYLKGFVLWLGLSLLLGAVWLAAWFTFVGPAFVSTYWLYASGAFWGYHYREAARDGVVPALSPAAEEPVASTDLRAEVAESR